MPSGGLFITLDDGDTMELYLDRGIYGQYAPPEHEEPSSYSNHYRVLADYACAEPGDHVFFFRERHFYYGGRLRDPGTGSAFFINGQYSPIGRATDAPLVWDESQRAKYDAVPGDPGLFEVTRQGTTQTRCHPFLVLFDDPEDMAGTFIRSDELYFELGAYPYPLPSNTMTGMGFRSVTPQTTEILLELLRDEPAGRYDADPDEDLTLSGDPVPFDPEFIVDSCEAAHPESHLEAAVLADPSLLPAELQPEAATVCRQVPVSPLKPRNMDETDICYYGDPAIEEGALPTQVLELKNTKAGKSAATQVARYLRWLKMQLSSADYEAIDVAILAPEYTGTFDSYIPSEYQSDYSKFTFDGPVGSTQTTLTD